MLSFPQLSVINIYVINFTVYEITGFQAIYMLICFK